MLTKINSNYAKNPVNGKHLQDFFYINQPNKV